MGKGSAVPITDGDNRSFQRGCWGSNISINMIDGG